VPGPPKSRLKSDLQKVFILDAQGGYAGEFVVVEDCAIEFGDFLSAVPETGLEDRQSIFLGEYRATALHGEKVSLIAISKGPVQPEELAWAKGALSATEGHFAEPGASAPATGPDKGVLENLAQAVEKREAQIAERESAFAQREAAAAKALEEQGRSQREEVEDLRRRLAEAEGQRDRAREEMGRIATAPAAGSDDEEEKKQLEKDKKMLQRRAVELLDREEKVRGREIALAQEIAKVQKARKENEAALAKLEAAKTPAPEFDVAAAKREIDMRVKILQQKALDLLDREEKLRKRQEELRKVEPG